MTTRFMTRLGEVWTRIAKESVETRAKRAFKDRIHTDFTYIKRGFEEDLFFEFTNATNGVSIISAPIGAGKTIAVKNLAKNLIERNAVTGVCYFENYSSLERSGNIMKWLLGQMDIEIDEKREVVTKDGKLETIKVSCVTKAVPRDCGTKYLLILDNFEELFEKSDDVQPFITSLAQECTFSNLHCILCMADTVQLKTVMSWNRNTKIRTFQTKI